MDALKELDRVAYLRFASVYKDFQETDDFRKFIDNNISLKSEQSLVQHDKKYLNIAQFSLEIIIGSTFPNPSVFAILVESDKQFRDNKIISFGHTSSSGRPHAEANTLENVHFKKNKIYTLYSTHDPCCHEGRDES